MVKEDFNQVTKMNFTLNRHCMCLMVLRKLCQHATLESSHEKMLDKSVRDVI